MNEYRLLKVKEGRCSFAKVAVRATKQAGNSLVVQAIADTINERDGEVNMASEPAWVQAAIEGASEALSVAEQSQKITDHFLVEVIRVVGTLVDTTENAVKCAAAMATWQALFPTSAAEPRLQVEINTKKWLVQYPA